MSDVFIPLPASPPIVELHLWIGHYAGGGEGLLSADFPLPGADAIGLRHMPLMSSDRAKTAAMKPIARRVQSNSQGTASRITRIELRTFRAEDNRLLIAAAPDMLAALKAALPGMHSLVAQDCPDPDVAAWDIAMRDQVLAAIAKAEGTGA